MFVLCPHCHFLVGIDPRTGAPPANCPKCGGVVVEPRPEPGAEPLTANATALAPFAPVALPSVAPVLPEPQPGREPVTAEIAPAPVPAAIEPEPEPEPAAAPIPAIEPKPTTPERKPRWWSRRKDEQPAAATPAAPAEVVALPAAAVESPPADARIATPPVRRRATKQPVTPTPAPVASSTVIEAVEIAIDVLPPAVQVEDVVAATTRAPDEPALEALAETPTQDGAGANGVDTFARVDTVDRPPPGHPLRRRTDTTAGALPDTSNYVLPTSHPLRRRTDVAAPSFTRPRVRASTASRTSWRSIGALAVLSLLLALQLLLAQRDTLAASSRWRPTMSTLCATLRCTLPPWREPAAFTMLSRDVRPHPGAPGTLLINASFRNDARWPQPWPSLLLTLSDLDGRMVGARTFAASEYLDAPPTQSGLASGQTAAVSLVVVEPAPDIVAFTFDFR